jgi:ketosteroid isomerase-like protein
VTEAVTDGGTMSDTEDVAAINQLVARYCHLIDAAQVDEWIELWTEDGAMVIDDSRTEGRDALLGLAGGVDLAMGMRHVVNNVVVDVDGDTATSSSYLQLVIGGRPPNAVMSGRYSDKLRRVDGRWRFVERALSTDG